MVPTIVETARGIPLDDDHRLIEHFLAGDESAFEQLYHAYYDKVYAIARGVLVDLDDAADAVQEIFTQVYRHLRRFDRRSKFSTWLFRIAVNRSIQLARRNKYRNRLANLDEASGKVAPEEPAVSDPQIERAMLQLAPADRALLALFYWDELSLAEIAQSLGCRENAAKTRLYRARERFRQVYEGGSE